MHEDWLHGPFSNDYTLRQNLRSEFAELLVLLHLVAGQLTKGPTLQFRLEIVQLLEAIFCCGVTKTCQSFFLLGLHLADLLSREQSVCQPGALVGPRHLLIYRELPVLVHHVSMHSLLHHMRTCACLNRKVPSWLRGTLQPRHHWLHRLLVISVVPEVLLVHLFLLLSHCALILAHLCHLALVAKDLPVAPLLGILDCGERFGEVVLNSLLGHEFSAVVFTR